MSTGLSSFAHLYNLFQDMCCLIHHASMCLHDIISFSSVIAGPVTFSIEGVESNVSLTIDALSYTSDDDAMIATFTVPTALASATDWLSITDRGKAPPSEDWQYLCGGKTACSEPVLSGTVTFALNEGLSASGEYDLTLFSNNGYSVLGGPVPFSFTFFCPTATVAASTVTHILPTEGSALTRVAFSSCYKPSRQTSSTLWEHVRQSGTELWLWLGDNQVRMGCERVFA